MLPALAKPLYFRFQFDNALPSDHGLLVLAARRPGALLAHPSEALHFRFQFGDAILGFL